MGHSKERGRRLNPEVNLDLLLQGLDGIDSIVENIHERGDGVIELGHVSEIARLVFHHHSKEFQGQRMMQRGTFERRVRAIIYKLCSIHGFDRSDEHDLITVLRNLGSSTTGAVLKGTRITTNWWAENVDLENGRA